MELPVEDATKEIDSPERGGIEWALEAGVVDEDRVETLIEKALSALNEPVQDHRPDDPEDTLFVHNSTPIDSSTGRFPRTLEREGSADTVRFTALFSPVDLDATSEFGTIDEWYRDSDRDVSTQFGSGVSDRTVEQSFAYPELLTGSQV